VSFVIKVLKDGLSSKRRAPTPCVSGNSKSAGMRVAFAKAVCRSSLYGGKGQRVRDETLLTSCGSTRAQQSWVCVLMAYSQRKAHSAFGLMVRAIGTGTVSEESSHGDEMAHRLDAKNNGEKTYFTGKPCKYNHVVHRYTKSGLCSACKAVLNRSWRRKKRAKIGYKSAPWTKAELDAIRGPRSKRRNYTAMPELRGRSTDAIISRRQRMLKEERYGSPDI
jgi:hypothetical protein